VDAVALVPRELLVIEASDIDGDSDGSSLVYTLSGGSVSRYSFPYTLVDYILLPRHSLNWTW